MDTHTSNDVLYPNRQKNTLSTPIFLYVGRVAMEKNILDFLTWTVHGKKIVVVKQGVKGVLGSDGSDLIHVRPHAVKEVDPTGAGDCFCGTLIGLLDQNKTFREALVSANMAGALHVTRRGPMEWNPTLTEVRKHLELELYEY